MHTLAKGPLFDYNAPTFCRLEFSTMATDDLRGRVRLTSLASCAG
ncbi:hypothetical protein [Candidatus Amarolinea aalborgensis]